jgi:CheY-like chemotaxis protein
MNMHLNHQSVIKILLVEDNPGDVLIVKEHLRFSGLNYELTEASTLKDATFQITHDHFDVVLLDLGLPDSVGIDTLKKFNLSRVEAPVIVMTGLDDEEAALISLKEGAQDYLFKNNIDAQSIVHSIRYGIERKKIQEFQKKNALQFSILASATTAINEAEEVPAIFTICSDRIKKLLNQSHVYTLESLAQINPSPTFFEWLEIGCIKSGINQAYHVKDFIHKLFEEFKKSISRSPGGRLVDISGGLKEFSNDSFNSEHLKKLEEVLNIHNIYIMGFTRDNISYGGIIIFSEREVEADERSILEVLINQVSLSIHRRTVEKDLIESEHRYRILNKDLEQRVAQRTEDLAKSNKMLEEELSMRIQLQKELMNSKKDLEIRVKERTAELARSEE